MTEFNEDLVSDLLKSKDRNIRQLKSQLALIYNSVNRDDATIEGARSLIASILLTNGIIKPPKRPYKKHSAPDAG